MRDDAGFSEAAISVRIVCIDHYLLPLSEYSTSQSFNVARLRLASASTGERIPVVRIFGATPAGQKACLHLHGALPYMYFPLPHGLSAAAAVALAAELRTALETGLRSLVERSGEGGAGDTGRAAIASLEPVKRLSIYGYESEPSIYLQLKAYNPRTIMRIPEVLGSLPPSLAALGLQPFESHIPFHLQVLTDLSLVGMGYVNLSKARFRLPLPPAAGDTVPARKLCLPNADRVFEDGIQLTRPDLVWPFSMPRRAKSELELDAFVGDVLNARKVEVAPDATGPAAFVTKTLRILWEEERLRTGVTPAPRAEEERPIHSGAECTDKYLHEKLRALQAGEAPASAPVASITPDSKRASEQSVRQSQESAGRSEERKLSASMPSSFDDVFNYLDETPIEDTEGGREAELDSEGEMEEAEDVETQWADIAQCSQSIDDVKPIPQGDGPGDKPEEKTPQRRPTRESGSAPRSKLRRKRMREQLYTPLQVEEPPPLTRSSAPAVFTQKRPSSKSIPAPTARRPRHISPAPGSVSKRPRVGSSSQARMPLQVVEPPPLTRSSAPEVFTQKRPDSKSIPAPTALHPLQISHSPESLSKRRRVGSSSQAQRLADIVDSIQRPSAVLSPAVNNSHRQSLSNNSEAGPKTSSGGLPAERFAYEFSSFPKLPPSQPLSSKNIHNRSQSKAGSSQPRTPVRRRPIGFEDAPEEDAIEDSADEKLEQPSQRRSTVTFSAEPWNPSPSPRLSQSSLRGTQASVLETETHQRDNQAQPSQENSSVDAFRIPSQSSIPDSVMPAQIPRKPTQHSPPSALSTPLPLTQTETAAGTSGGTSGAHSRRRSRTFGGSQTPSDRFLPGQIPSPSPMHQRSVARKLPLDSPRSASTPLPLSQVENVIHELRIRPDRSEREQGSTTCFRPTQAPPSISELRESQLDEVVPSVVHTPPFFGNPKDAPQKPEVFAGVTFRIPVGGLQNLPACITPFRDEDEGEIALVSHIMPARRPPTLSDLLAADARTVRKAGPLGTQRVVIDSAGRQIRVHDRNPVGFESMSQESSQAPPPGGADAVKRRGSGDGDGDESDSDISVGEDLMSLSASRYTPAKKQRPLQSIADRPLSPKIGEYRFYEDFGSSQEQYDHRHSSRMQSATKSPTTSLHANQNVTYVAIEILASCIGKNEPDPDKNPILAVCAVVVDSRNHVQHKSQLTLLQTGGKSRRLSPSCCIQAFATEGDLLDGLVSLILRADPDFITGFETQNASIGYILERAASIGHSFPTAITRNVERDKPRAAKNERIHGQESAGALYMRQKGYNVNVKGRHVINLWRVIRSDVKLACYSAEGVALELLQIRLPRHTAADLEMLLRSPKTAPRALSYLCRRAQMVVDIIEKIDVVGRTGELSRVFGVDFMSVLTRGSQFRVESMLARVAHERDFVLLAAQKEQVFAQPAVESLPLVMEPMSALYVDPVIVLDFQSLYPSMIIAHNLCYSTMMGNINRLQSWDDPRQLGVVKGYTPPRASKFAPGAENKFFIAPNGEMFVTKEERLGILPQMLNEILTTRIMVKAALKAAGKSDAALAKLLNSRQFGLKMIANVTYGYSSASFSGRMPCANLADAIVQCGRDALEKMIDYVDNELSETTGASVVYGDTDSLFVRVPGATRAEAFDIGDRIAAKSLELFPHPVRLQLEKVYHPCVLQAKKRYVGYMYESRDQAVPTFDAKGIETVRRDSCALVQSTLERAVRVLFETRDLSSVKRLVQRTFQRVLHNRLPLSMYIFRKEVKLGNYKEGHLPPAAIVAARAIARDPRRAPRWGERVPFVVVFAGAGAALKDSVVSPEQLLAAERDGLARLNATYYITKQVIPALDRVLALVGVRVAGWFAEMPRTAFAPLGARLRAGAASAGAGNAAKNSLYRYYASAKCTLCRGKSVRTRVCGDCVCDEAARRDARFVLQMRVRRLQKTVTEMRATCATCVDVVGADVAAVECTNLSCEVKLGLNSSALKLQGCQDAISDENFW